MTTIGLGLMRHGTHLTAVGLNDDLVRIGYRATRLREPLRMRRGNASGRLGYPPWAGSSWVVTERGLDDGHERRRLGDELFRVVDAHQMDQPGLGRGALLGADGEVGGPLGQFGLDLGKELPRAAQAASAAVDRLGPGGEDGRGRSRRAAKWAWM